VCRKTLQVGKPAVTAKETRAPGISRFPWVALRVLSQKSGRTSTGAANGQERAYGGGGATVGVGKESLIATGESAEAVRVFSSSANG
jgi:hypothetical protein